MPKEINESCPCTASCARHGDCEACQTFHAADMTTCQRIKAREEAQ